MTAQWPALPLNAWQDTCATLHLWTQIVGKVRLVQMPWINHQWHVTLYVTARGLTTSAIPHGERIFDVELDFVAHRLVIRASDGAERSLPLRARSVADFHAEFLGTLEAMGLVVHIHGTPNEVENAIPFADDRQHASYDREYANRFWRVLVQSDRVFREFRARFRGKVSPVHFFWGGPDLAVTRFSGRTAPPHPGGIPNLPDWITREAYSHEVSSAGFWPGGGPHPWPLFYSYAYPEPPGFSDVKVKPDAAFYSQELHEFVLPYDAVRESQSPDETLLAFLQSTYEAAANLAEWDRKALENASGFPRAFAKKQIITDPAAWIGPQIQNDASWMYNIGAGHIEEIDAALRHAKRTGARIPFGKELFPLPRFSKELDKIVDEIENGRGLLLIRGIPRSRYSDDDCELLYWGIGVHLGTPVSQNARGHLLGHVRDEGRVHADPNARGYQTRQRMDFHTDLLPVDLLGLFCVRTAKSGGESKVVSALTIHNVLREERPDLLEALYEPFNVDWRGEEPAGERPFFAIPMFTERAGKVTTRLVSVPYYKSVSRFGEEHAPGALQLEALEKVQEIANRPELMLSMEFREGDIQLLNNHVMMHARTEFEDFDEPGMQRHLLRMWIAVDDARRRPLAESLAPRYEWVKRGGIPAKA